MTNIISIISSLILGIIGKAGYFGVFILSALESCGILIPSEIVVPFSGFLASTGRFTLPAVVFVTTFANLVGAITLYYIGKSGGRWVLDKYGKYILIYHHDLEVGEDWFKKYGSHAIFWSRMLPIVRTFIPLAAGVAKMNSKKFAFLTFAGSLPWNLGLAWLGYIAGENWGYLRDYFKQADVFILIIVVLAAIYYVWHHIKRHRTYE